MPRTRSLQLPESALQPREPGALRAAFRLLSLALVLAACRPSGGLGDTSGAPRSASSVSSPGGASQAGVGAVRRAASRAEPSLITSGPGSYWNVGALEPGAAGSAEVVVDPSRQLQRWHGLGGTFNEAGWDALQVLPEAERQRALRLLFDAEEGIGLTWGRIPIGASDYALSRYTHDDRPSAASESRFDIERDEKYLLPFIRAARALKPDLRLWGSPWTPPPWMKTNGSYDRGAFDPRYMDEMARYLVAWVQAYENRQIPIDHVQPQNEPGWSQAYPSCAWGPSTADGVTTDRPVTLGTFVERHLAPALQSAGLKTGIWYGTLSNGGTFDAYWSALSPAGRRLVRGVGLQWGTLARVAEVASTGLLVMQTEHKCGNYPWLRERATSPADAHRGNFLSDRAPNNHAYAEESWDMIKAWVEAGVNAYNAWNLVLDSVGLNLDESRPWPQNALLAVDRAARELHVTPAYYVFRHIGQYVEPGAVRLEVRGGNALSFENPDGSVVTVLFNEATSPRSTTLSLGGDSVMRFEIPARGWATVHWQG